jgi:hypothetical protein
MPEDGGQDPNALQHPVGFHNLVLLSELHRRDTSSSASLDAAERASSAIHPASRTNIKYSIRAVTSRDLASSEAITVGILAGQPPVPRFGNLTGLACLVAPAR